MLFRNGHANFGHVKHVHVHDVIILRAIDLSRTFLSMSIRLWQLCHDVFYPVAGFAEVMKFVCNEAASDKTLVRVPH